MQDTPHLRAIGCNDKVTSVRCGPGTTCDVFSDAEYQGCVSVVCGADSRRPQQVEDVQRRREPCWRRLQR